MTQGKRGGMRASEVYLRAAILIDSGKETYSCRAVGMAAGAETGHGVFIQESFFSTPSIVEYDALFRPDQDAGGVWGNLWGNSAKETKSCRVLALLFMHHIARDEERGRK